jgi:putative peptidoglycan lipid II flippase
MLLKSGIIVGFFTLISRFFGLARELFIAATFGTSQIADCVNVAFKLPNLFRRIFGEGALSAVFIPMYSEKLVTSKEDAKKFSGEIFILLLLTLICLTIILQIFMPLLMVLIAPGFFASGEKYGLAVTLCRITIPYVIFVSITALLGGMLNSVRKFAAFAFVPILMNICVIVVPYILRNNVEPHYSISFSLIIAGIIQVGFMFYCIIRNGLKFPILFKPKDPEVKKLLRKMGPATMSSGAQQLSLFISQSIASFLPGAVSILSYADRLYQLPLSLIGVTFGTILLPELSKIYKKKNYDEANFIQNKAIKVSFVISIPAMFGLITLAEPIIHLIYERGEFTSSDTSLTANALTAFAFGLPAFVLAKIVTPIFYANLDTKTPFRITVYSLFINTSLNIILMIPFGHVGIAIGSSIAAWINFWLLNKHAKQYGRFCITNETKIFALKNFVCGIIMVGFILISIHYFGELFYSDIFAIKAASILSTIAIAVVVFTISAYFLKIHKILLKKT